VVMAAILAITLSIVMMVQFTKRIIEPAEKLAQTVRQIGRGRLDLKIDVDTNDEVGELSREFNKMTERLRQFEKLNIDNIISEKKKSETIVESISDIIMVCDSEFNIQLINKTAEDLFNIHEEAVIGRKIQECISDERIIEIFESTGKASIMKKPYLQFTNNGRLVYLRPRISEIPAVHGGRSGIVLILQDVSQFRELDKMKSDFMATVSHEFRTPLTSINMSVDIMRQKVVGPLTDAQAELLESSKQDCDRLTKLVKELLQLSKLESGKFELKREPVEFERVIDAALQPLQLPFKEKGVELKSTVGADLPLFMGDEQQLTWVVSNLASNALRYTPNGGNVCIDVKKDGENILMLVKDTGRGIQPEHIEKIFDKFVQVKHALDSTPGSVGLGLAIVKEIVEMYNGRIWVESEIGKGASFFISLPGSERAAS
jgi:NtrC-family two-component system sensor histidine kinase KinB